MRKGPRLDAERIQSLYDLTVKWEREKVDPRDIIDRHVNLGNAIYRRGDPQTLRMANVVSTCTSGQHGLIQNWKRAATLAILRARGATE